MDPSLPESLPLVCPACRRTEQSEGAPQLLLSTLAVDTQHRVDDSGRLLDGALVCLGCARRYPVVEGLPLLVPEPAAWLAEALLPLLLLGRPTARAAMSIETLAHLAASSSADAPLPKLLERLSTYLDASWGDCAEPAPALVGDPLFPRLGAAPLLERLEALPPVEQTVELGAGCGRAAFALSSRSSRTLALDLDPAALLCAQALGTGQPLRALRRVGGRSFVPVTLHPTAPARNLHFIVGDALDPPLAPGGFDRAAALHLLDNVPDPAQLLTVLDGLLRPGGELLLATPYAWSAGLTDESRQLDPDTLRRRLLEGQELSCTYALVDETELSWTLRRDARSAVRYGVHYLRARKG
jgi:SAM-dependent methyltransferase/uncharacterized protein YbaR (Trm112 family)